MMIAMALLFYSSIFFILFAYLGYPLVLFVMGAFRRRRVRRAEVFPPLTVIITAYNEEKRMAAKLDNTLAQDYPRENLQILVASDGSTDDTHKIVSSYADRGVQLVPVAERRGKENAQKEAIRQATGDIYVFSDVATQLDPGGLKQIVGNFADPSVGCVSSEDRLVRKDGQPAGEGIYVRYEMLLRRLESRVNSLVGLSGSFFAARREACRNLSADMQSDFCTLLSCIKMGLRGICDPAAIGYYLDVSDPSKEMDRKIRTVLRGLTVLFRHAGLFNVFRYGFFSFQLFSHKLLRWLVPFWMFAALVSNAILAPTSLGYLVLFFVQLGFYLTALFFAPRAALPRNMLVRLITYFVSVNVAIIVAWWRYLRGVRVVMWTPSER
jgi:cellulose synthase/poly-beta-1,6-N-acetylglucosamine synthase-like glycosyltransferase